MYKVSVNGKPQIEVSNKDGKFYIGQTEVDFDIVANSNGTYHAIYKGKSYNIGLVEKNREGLILKINHQKSEVKIKTELEDLLSKMGMDKMAGNAMNELKAPMPGMVLKLLVNEGDTIKKGDSLIVLEAMKMENNIKALGDGVVSKILIKAGDKVEKNQVLIAF